VSLAPLPPSGGALAALPLWTTVASALSGLVWAAWCGSATGLLIAGGQALLLGALALHLVWRSDFGATHGLWVAALLAGLLLPLAAGAVGLGVQMSGPADRAVSGAALAAAAVAALSLLACGAWPAWRHARALAAAGPDGPWTRAHADLARGRLGPAGSAPAVSAPPVARPPGGWGPAWAAALGLNLPGWWPGMARADAATLAAALVWGAAAALALGWIGPRAGQAWWLLRLQRRLGRVLRRPDEEQLRALRASHWFTRRGAPRTPHLRGPTR
jgi:hypothetical protein